MERSADIWLSKINRSRAELRLCSGLNFRIYIYIYTYIRNLLERRRLWNRGFCRMKTDSKQVGVLELSRKPAVEKNGLIRWSQTRIKKVRAERITDVIFSEFYRSGAESGFLPFKIYRIEAELGFRIFTICRFGADFGIFISSTSSEQSIARILLFKKKTGAELGFYVKPFIYRRGAESDKLYFQTKCNKSDCPDKL